MIFDGAAMKESRGLHLATWRLQVQLVVKCVKGSRIAEALSLRKNEKTGHRFLLTPVIKGIVDGSEGHQRCIFNVRYELDILWEGCDMLTLSVYQHNLFLANTLLGSCEMPLSLCYEQLVSSAKSCNPGEAKDHFQCFSTLLLRAENISLKLFVAESGRPSRWLLRWS